MVANSEMFLAVREPISITVESPRKICRTLDEIDTRLRVDRLSLSSVEVNKLKSAQHQDEHHEFICHS